MKKVKKMKKNRHKALLALLVLGFYPIVCNAQSHDIYSFPELKGTVYTSGDTINIKNSFPASSNIGSLGEFTLGINGNNNNINGANTYNGFVMGAGSNYTINELNINNFNSNPGNLNTTTTGGAIFNTGSGLVINNSSFDSNFAKTSTEIAGNATINSYGGAVFTASNSSITSATSDIFSNNYSLADSKSTAGRAFGYAYGGAIYSAAPNALTIENISFDSNYAKATATGLTRAEAYAFGGAVNGYKTLITSTTSNYINNNYAYAEARSATGTSVATIQGGAIYNGGSGITIKNISFDNNYARGVVYSESGNINDYAQANIAGGVIWANLPNDNVSITSTSTNEFNNNRVIAEAQSIIGSANANADSGAIFSNVYNGNIDLKNINFTGNSSAATSTGGAYANANAKAGVMHSIQFSATTTILNDKFTNNFASATASSSGETAVTSYGGVILAEGNAGITNITDSSFQNNFATASASGTVQASATATGGIISFNGGSSEINMTNTSFKDNSVSASATSPAYATAAAFGGVLSTSEGNGTKHITNVNFTGNSATASINSSHGSASAQGGVLNVTGGGLTTNVTNSTFTNNTVTATATNSTNVVAKAYGGAIYHNAGGSQLNITNSTFTNNTATATSSGTASALGGAIYNAVGTVNIVASGGNSVFTNNKANGVLNDIYLAGSGAELNLNALTGNSITFNSGISSADASNYININKVGSPSPMDPQVSAPTNGDIVFNNNITNSIVNLYGGTLKLGKDSYLDNNSLKINNNNGMPIPTIDLANSSVGQMNLSSLTLNSSANLKIDANLATKTADYINPTSFTDNTAGVAKMNIQQVNLLGDSSKSVNIPIANGLIANYIELGSTIAESPIFKYNLAYDRSSGNMSFTNTNQFSPSVQSTPVSTSVGTYLNEVNTYHETLSRVDTFMTLPYSERLLMKYNNKYASAAGSDANGPVVFSPTFLPEENGGLWFKQYTTFENIPLKNGPNVSNVSYGMLIGADTPITHLKHGFDGYMTAYVGYSGSHQNYDNVGINQNGGLLGLTGTAYKGNFFASVTANAGESSGSASTKFGNDYFNTIMAGIAAKTGYNFEFLSGKLILQPSYSMSYTFANTFDYTTAAGVNITSDPLNAVQISPGLKLIGNLQNGWQPYLDVNMVWNIMDAQKFYANNISLPQMSIAPYVEYGVGVQRRWGNRFTGFAQTMFRGGGRNGVAFQFGFRLAIGK